MRSTPHSQRKPPIGLLFDYGGTLIEELGYDERAANAWLLTHAASKPEDVSLDDVMARLTQLTFELRSKNRQSHVEVPWLALTRLAYASLGIQLDAPLEYLELGYWRKTARTRAMPGALDALKAFEQRHVPMAMVSNCRFGRHVLRYELGRYDLSRYLAFVMVSAEYAVRKPHPTLFDSAARRLGLGPDRVWFVGDNLDTDISGAKAAGMKAIWLRPPGNANVSARDADFAASGWHEIVDFLAGTASPLVGEQAVN